MIEIRVLGSLDVRGTGGVVIEIASEAQRRLISILALQTGTVVRGVTLECELGLSAGAVRTSISRLRRLLGPDALTTTPLGYTLDAVVDVIEFERLAASAPTHRDDTARDLLEQATRLWRGAPLVEFASEPWALGAVARLNEAHATAVEDLAVILLDVGEAAIALPAIQALIDDHPYRDRPRALLVRALAESGRRTDALRAFQTYRTLLLDEIGTEPSSALAALDRAVASAPTTTPEFGPFTGHPAWTRTRSRAAAVATSHTTPDLPVPVSSFVGRVDEVETISGLINSNRLVTLTGAGGCGKTRLALAVAEATTVHHPAGTCWVGLGSVTNATQVLEQVARSVGLAAAIGIDPVDQLVRDLERDEPSLLVVDNAEHVLAPVAALTAELLSRCRTLGVLVTSREPVGLAGEVVWRVPPLAPSDARALFLERAVAARSSLVIDDDATRHVASICAGLDGLPLAIELAAARARTLPLDSVARGVDDALRWQSTGIRSPLAHHATLHASISWSVDLLDPAARDMLTRLSVFQSAFTIDSALAVGARLDSSPTDPSSIDALSALVDASLLELDDLSGRYHMLRIVRQFCVARMQGTAELHAAHARHTCHLADWCTEVGNGLHGIERGPLVAEIPDVVAALEWARSHDPLAAFRMCAGLACVRSSMGYNSNVLETWTWLRSIDPTSPPFSACSSDWAAAVAALMAPATAQGIDLSVAVDELEAHLPADRLRERGWLARGAAMFPAYRGHVGPIMSHVREATSRGDEMELYMYGGFAAYMLSMMGRRPDVHAQLDELHHFTQRHHTTFSVDTVGNGYAAAVLDDMMSGDLRAAAHWGTDRVPADPAFSMTAAAALAQVALLADDANVLARAIQWSQQETIPMLSYLPTLIALVSAMMSGSHDRAADLAEQYWDESRQVPVGRCHQVPTVTAALIAAGRPDAASAIVGTAEELTNAMDPAPWLQVGVLHGRAQLALDRGDSDALLVHAHDLGHLAANNSFGTMSIDAIEFAGATNGPDPSLLEEAGSLRDRIGYRWRPVPLRVDLRDATDAPL